MTSRADLLAAALVHHQDGQLDRASAIYRDLLASVPDDADVLSFLAAASIGLGQLAEAEANLSRALEVAPSNPRVHTNLGVLRTQQDRLAEAAEHFRLALEANPRHVDALLNLANTRLSQGDAVASIELARRALDVDSDSLRAHSLMVDALKRNNQTTETIVHLRAVVRLLPDEASAQTELADALKRAGQLEEAEFRFRESLRLDPADAATHVDLAAILIARRSSPEAAAMCQRAVRLQPDLAEAHGNLGAALVQQEQFEEATAALEEALRLKPDLAHAHGNLGLALAGLGKVAEAEASHRRAVALDPSEAQGWNNLGIALLMRNETAEALTCFDRAIERQPDYAEAHSNRAAALLSTGQFIEGFKEYEWRFEAAGHPPFHPPWPIWNGEPLAGRTIVVYAEQGIGDTLQFIRYAELLRQRGARVIVECPDFLHRILSRTPGVDAWASPAAPASRADFGVTMLSLPRVLETTLETIPSTVPYLFAAPDLVNAWRERLLIDGQFRVGIAWQGNSRFASDHFRSIALAEFEPLTKVPGVRLVSLQKGPGVEQLPAVAAWNVLDFGDALDSEAGAFMDTAAIIKHLDLLVTSDTSLAHLAGGLGADVWVALEHACEWRWMLKREDSPWYPTMRLFRQTALQDWRGVFERIAAELALFVAARDRNSPA